MPKEVGAIKSDILLAEKIVLGDESAFQELYEQNYKHVYAVCLRLHPNNNAAEDMVQETFVQAWKKMRSYKGQAKLSTWLHRIAVNQCLMHFRKKEVKAEKVSIEETTIDVIKALIQRKVDPKDYLRAEIEQAINKLPPGYKNVYILKDVRGFEHSEVAQILGCTEGTSKSQLFKARERMKQLLTTNLEVLEPSFS